MERVWGGHSLAALGKRLPDARAYGESWEVADLPEGSSLIDSGPLAGQPLSYARALWGEALVGPRSHQGRFPLLVKYIDAEADLSIQVHPGPAHADPASAAYIAGAHSKDESWLILATRPGAAVLVGFSAARTRAEVEAAIGEGTIAHMLDRLTPAPGDLLHIEPGTVHAICAGVTLLEIQQPSDTTYRVFDYNRPGTDGAPRPLHVAQALAVMHTAPRAALCAPSPTRLGAHAATLRHDGAYTITQLTLAPHAPLHLPLTDARPAALNILSGALTLDDGYDSFVLNAHQTGVVPSACGAATGRAGANGAEIVVSW
jgi:mannose-6-phosphate isomerase